MRVPRRHPNGYHWIPPDKEWLLDQYITQRRPVYQIAREVGTYSNTFRRWLEEEGIPIRTRVQALEGVRRGGTSWGYLSLRAWEVLWSSGIPERCDICGTAEGRMDAHHRDGDRKNYLLENLQWLCRSCHRKLHSIRNSEVK